MTETNPLKLMDEMQKKVVKMVVNGQIDPFDAFIFFRRSVKEIWDINDSDDSNILFWNSTYSRFNTYILLSEIEMLGILGGKRNLREEADKKILSYGGSFWIVKLRTRDWRSIRDDFNYQKHWNHKKGHYKLYGTLSEMVNDLEKISRRLGPDDWISIEKLIRSENSNGYEQIYQITNRGYSTHKAKIELKVMELIKILPYERRRI